MKRTFVFILLLFLIYRIAGVFSGCANIIPPDGGSRDSLPPVLIRVSPGDSTRNFTGNRIVLTFDEFIDIPTWRENVIVSPAGVGIDITSRLNTITVKLKDTLEANTTYMINFGDAIKDFNEGNIFKNFNYVFSTGPFIDSLELSGKVILAETGKIDTNLIVMLHTNPDDSAVVNQNPRYVTRLNSSGSFTFRNLPPKTFYLYALKDDGGGRRYQNERQLFAFAEKPVTLRDTNAAVTLYAYNIPEERQQGPSGGISIGNRFNKNVTATAGNRLKYQTNLSANQQDLLTNFILTFEQPLKQFDSLKLRLYTDSLFIPATGYRFQKDSSNQKIELINNWKENTTYHLILNKDFATDSSGKQLLKTDTITFKTKKLAEYGSLQLKFRNLDLAANPVVLFVTGETIIKKVPLRSPDLTVPLIQPGEYELRILYDKNKNGTWDPGEFFGKHKQPELVKPIERRITVKGNWQNEFEIEARN